MSPHEQQPGFEAGSVAHADPVEEKPPDLIGIESAVNELPGIDRHPGARKREEVAAKKVGVLERPAKVGETPSKCTEGIVRFGEQLVYKLTARHGAFGEGDAG